MLETFLVAFTAFFATIGPQDAAVIFAALTPDLPNAERRRLALRATAIGSAILLFFAVFGETLLSYLGISLAAMRTAGGVLLLLIAIDMVFARVSGAASATPAERAEAAVRDDISVFPLATPLIAGPGAIGAAILLMADARDAAEIAAVLSAMLSVLFIAYLLMLAASPVQRLLGRTGAQVVARVLGVLLAALAVQFIFDGVKESGLFSA
ncbi:MAG: MarC family protein [Pseudomonadota bacterium]